MTPVKVMYNEKHSEKFCLVSKLKFENTISINKYKCLRTGITIVFSDIEGPLVKGYFMLGNYAQQRYENVLIVLKK